MSGILSGSEDQRVKVKAPVSLPGVAVDKGKKQVSECMRCNEIHAVIREVSMIVRARGGCTGSVTRYCMPDNQDNRK